MTDKAAEGLDWSRVANVGQPGCWEWVGARHPHGYGQLVRRGKMHYAHRMALEERLGRSIMPGLRALHECDNPPCVRPDHLIEGTAARNSADMAKRGRARNRSFLGEANGSAKLTLSAVRAIRADAKRGVRQVDLAAQHGVTQACISLIVRRASWRHVED